MRTFTIFFFVLVSLCMFQCENNTTIGPKTDFVSVSYNETQCASPWQNGPTDTETLQNVETFLMRKNILFKGTSIEKAKDDFAAYTCCTCWSGRVIKGTVHKDALAKIKDLNFVP